MWIHIIHIGISLARMHFWLHNFTTVIKVKNCEKSYPVRQPSLNNNSNPGTYFSITFRVMVTWQRPHWAARADHVYHSCKSREALQRVPALLPFAFTITWSCFAPCQITRLAFDLLMVIYEWRDISFVENKSMTRDESIQKVKLNAALSDHNPNCFIIFVALTRLLGVCINCRWGLGYPLSSNINVLYLSGSTRWNSLPQSLKVTRTELRQSVTTSVKLLTGLSVGLSCYVSPSLRTVSFTQTGRPANPGKP